MLGFSRQLISIVAFIIFAAPAFAQNATLLADTVNLNGNQTITATGNVEILYEGIRLTAVSITYDDADGSLVIEGPITLNDGDSTVIIADSAKLSADLQQGILNSARMVMNQQLQIAAAEIARVDGRYTQLYKTVASSCQVCAKNPVPLWRIRAEKIIHDQQERQLYFEKAQILIGNVPVFYLPRLRMPDPTLKRARGFLVPKFKNSSLLGTGINIPYFVPIGDHADLTFAPFITNKTRTLEFRYRQAFHNGKIEFEGAFTDDDLVKSKRAYLFGNGNFVLPRKYKLSFDLELTSDSAYLQDYAYSTKDRIANSIALTRTRRDEYFNASIVNFQTLRGSELAIEDQLPNFRGEVSYEKRFVPGLIGGVASWQIGLEGHTRNSSLDQLGRDVTKIAGQLDWSKNRMFSNGMVGRIGARLETEAYFIKQDSTYAENLYFATPSLEAELRWPLVKTDRSGASMMLEPIAHLAWTKENGPNVPNDDSTLVEFDEGNLFALSRFPGDDRNERGLRATTGIKWTRYDPDGWSIGVTLGRVIREKDLGQFSNASGLDGSRSDWLLATQVKLDNRLSLMARAQITDDLTATKTETRIDWRSEKLTLATSYSWILRDTDENRANTTSQLVFDSSYRLGRNWRAKTDWRYDFIAEETTRAGIGFGYSTDCLNIDLSLSRRFTSSSNVTADTTFGLSVSLNGFGASGRANRPSCSG